MTKLNYSVGIDENNKYFYKIYDDESHDSIQRFDTEVEAWEAADRYIKEACPDKPQPGMIDVKIAKKHVTEFMNDLDHGVGVKANVGEGEFDTKRDYTNKNSLFFVIFYEQYGNHIGQNDLVHVVKKPRGYALMYASALNWRPSKDNCMCYRFISNEDWDK